MSNILLSATRSFTLPPGLRYCKKCQSSGTILSPHSCDGVYAHLRLAKNLDTQCIAERVNSDQRCVSYTVYTNFSVSPRTIARVDDGHAPISPVTPSSISSLRNSMGVRLALVVALSSVRLLYVDMTDVVAKERENPMRMP